jgi:hypothetical protein
MRLASQIIKYSLFQITFQQKINFNVDIYAYAHAFISFYFSIDFDEFIKLEIDLFMHPFIPYREGKMCRQMEDENRNKLRMTSSLTIMVNIN